MEKYNFNIKFAEIGIKGKAVNGFATQIEIIDNNYEVAVMRALLDAQNTIRTLDGNWFFRVERM